MRNEIVEKATEYVGYREGKNNDTIFGTWYGLPNQPWCAMFISYCADKVGISQDIIKRFASCTNGFNWFKEKGQATREHIIPRPGDIIFFVWTRNETTPDHVGLVEYIENNKVHTIEGNRSDKVQSFEYDLDSWQIYGYAQPAYTDNAENANRTSNDVKTINCIYDIQNWLKTYYGFNLALDNIYGTDTHKKLVMALQTELNVQYNKGLSIDGIFGNNTYNACVNVRQGAKGNITKLIQCLLFIKGYLLEIDGIFGTDTAKQVGQFQNDNNLTSDCIVGKNTFNRLFK